MNPHKPTAAEHAIGALKLVELHLDFPTVIDRATVRGASREAIERLQQPQDANARHLPALFCALFHRLPRGYVPHVTVTTDPQRPFGVVVTDPADNVVARQLGKTIEGLVELVAAQLPLAGAGEARA
ncbi:hypothetical protein CK486_08480 [Pseudomonas sp. HAR-UPW-AIA-41]|uniref:hypothetical protein n=1 Tax=Pseudomonas sp. HAR-UPW-AIA-41 TaxID=1985301 RepID=UPI000BB35E27|nr:hypothetical protein [Pseudomonas sp. HAR-UPW-AIA-41]PAV48475.1 hypothetical protein CK486_08480 [Pseudomonas sp. HAR-UPW-AIA-41]